MPVLKQKPKADAKANDKSDAKANGKPAAAKPEPKTEKPTMAKMPAQKPPSLMPVVYPVLTVNGVEIPEDNLVIGLAMAKQLLGWESEAEYAIRSGKKPGSITFGPTVDVILTDEHGEKIWCQNNCRNRPFGEGWARQLAQDILNGNWQLNYETIVVSRTGQITSGQHRLIALVLACQMWEKDKAAYPLWTEEPTIRGLVAFGGSDEQSVLNTIDNTRPQAPSDAFYRVSAELFARKTNVERKELCRMLDAGMDLAWKRTGYGVDRYQTISESVLFEERHPKLVQAVLHVFEKNADRTLSSLKISAGQCAAMLYFMAASETDGEAYRKGQPPSQKDCDMSLWEDACEFITTLGIVNGPFAAARKALSEFVDDNNVKGNKHAKLAIIAKAWKAFRAGAKKLAAEHVSLKDSYKVDAKTGVKTFVDDVDFGGIDIGPFNEPDEDELTDAQKVKAAKAEQKQKIAEHNAKVRAAKEAKANEAPKSIKQQVSETVGAMEKKYPNRFLIFRSKTAGHVLYNANAVKAGKLLGKKPEVKDEISKLLVSDKDWVEALPKLLKGGLKVALIEKVKVNEKGVEEDKCRDLFESKA